MPEEQTSDTRRLEGAGRPDDPDRVAWLLQLAGPRPKVPPERAERVREQIYDQWRLATRARKRRRFLAVAGPLAAAATLAAVFLLPRGSSQPTPVEPAPAPPVEVAQVEAVSGAAFETDVESPRGRLDPMLAVGGVLWSGRAVETSPAGRAALRLEGGSSIRLDRNTRLRLVSASEFELERGAVYVDSGLGPDEGRAVEIHTAVGVVRDVGTQFEVRTQTGGVRIRVREGLVNVDGAGESWETTAGGELSVGDDGSVERAEVPVFGPDWSWILQIAPSFELEGSNLEEFLAWAERETGWQVRYEDPSVARSASGVVLHGAVKGLPPDQAIDVVLPTCGLTYRIEDGSLWIRSAPRRS